VDELSELVENLSHLEQEFVWLFIEDYYNGYVWVKRRCGR